MYLDDYLFQSTLPREERLSKFKSMTEEQKISIHAPTRGATSFIISTTSPISISIHAPTRGATRAFILCSLSSVISIHAPTRGATTYHKSGAPIHDFNPRSHERSDSVFFSFWAFLLISIHAPTRGATFPLPFFTSCYYYFNPRSHERSDISKIQHLFLPKDFNPRSHERSDILRLFYISNHRISIHAPTRGAT